MFLFLEYFLAAIIVIGVEQIIVSGLKFESFLI